MVIRLFLFLSIYSIPLMGFMKSEDEGDYLYGSSISSQSLKQKKKKKTTDTRDIASSTFNKIEEYSEEDVVEQGCFVVQSLSIDQLKKLCVQCAAHCSDKHRQELQDSLIELYTKNPDVVYQIIAAATKSKKRNFDLEQAAQQSNAIFTLAVEQLLKDKDHALEDQAHTIVKKSFRQKISAAIGGTALIVQFAFVILLLVKQIVEC